MSDSLLITRALAQQLFHLAQTTDGRLAGTVRLRADGDYRVMPEGKADATTFAEFGVLPHFEAALPAFVATHFLGLSLNTKGVLELRAWRRSSDGLAQPVTVHILTH